MRRRKKTIIAAFVTLGAIAALVFWPRDHPQARQAFAAVRGLVEIQSEAFAEVDDEKPSPIDNGKSGAVPPPPPVPAGGPGSPPPLAARPAAA